MSNLEGKGFERLFNAIFGKKRSKRNMTNKVEIFTDAVKSNKEAFIKEVEAVSSRLDIDPNWLMAVMWKESRLNAQAVNKTGGATGLIQFMPNTAKGLGTSTNDLYNMSNINQLKYVEKYFKPYKDKINSYMDLYLVTFFPIALSKTNDWFFQTSTLTKEKIGIQNKGINEGKPINKIAFKKYLLNNIDPKYLQYLA